MNTDSLLAQFKSIYDAHSDAVFRFCIVKVTDRDTALDITQETFTRLWQNMLNGKSMPNGKSYVFTIANHLIIDWYRKKKAVSLHLYENESGEVASSEFSDSDEKNHELEAEGRFVMSKINELSDAVRQAVYLRYVEGFSPPEIADVLGISANAVSIRINRGIEELKRTGYANNQHGK